VLVEGGAKTLEHFLQEGCWDEIHVIENPHMLTGKGTPAPAEPQPPLFSGKLGTDLYRVYLHPDWVTGQNAPDLNYLRDHFIPQPSLT
jgi:riboflavin biosynthesis pyrimidine reductase